MNSLHEKLLPVLMEHKLTVCVGLAGVVFLLYGLFTTFMPVKANNHVIISSSKAKDFNTSSGSDKASAEKKDNSSEQITIDVAGAVTKPGVYSLKNGSRVKDALLAAGGFSETVDKQAVAQSLNLAAPLVDGAKLYIPAVGDEMVTSGGVSGNTSSGGKVLGTNSGQVNINQASETELDTLSGVGKITAQKIISNRPYKSIQELTEKKVVGASVFEKIKNSVTVF